MGTHTMGGPGRVRSRSRTVAAEFRIRAVNALRSLEAAGEVERRNASEIRRGDVHGVSIAFPIPRREWRLGRDGAWSESPWASRRLSARSLSARRGPVAQAIDRDLEQMVNLRRGCALDLHDRPDELNHLDEVSVLGTSPAAWARSSNGPPASSSVDREAVNNGALRSA